MKKKVRIEKNSKYDRDSNNTDFETKQKLERQIMRYSWNTKHFPTLVEYY